MNVLLPFFLWTVASASMSIASVRFFLGRSLSRSFGVLLFPLVLMLILVRYVAPGSPVFMTILAVSSGVFVILVDVIQGSFPKNTLHRQKSRENAQEAPGLWSFINVGLIVLLWGGLYFGDYGTLSQFVLLYGHSSQLNGSVQPEVWHVILLLSFCVLLLAVVFQSNSRLSSAFPGRFSSFLSGATAATAVYFTGGLYGVCLLLAVPYIVTVTTEKICSESFVRFSFLVLLTGALVCSVSYGIMKLTLLPVAITGVVVLSLITMVSAGGRLHENA